MTTSEIPKKHKAIVYDSPGTLSVKIEEIDTPEPGLGEVLVHLTHSGVCHSDYGVMTNSWRWLPHPTQKGQVGGHEGVGVVAKLGHGLENSTVKIGDRVGIKWVSAVCHSCPACLSGSEGCCFSAKISGYYTPGTFQQFALAPANYVTPIPDSVPSDVAAPLLCGGVTVYSALKKSRAQPGDWIVIPGAGGGLGHLACQIAGKGMGFRVLGIDSKEKEDFVKECGAEEFLALDSFSRDEEGNKKLTEEVKKLTGGVGAAAVIVCTAANAAYAQALTFLKFNGTLVAVGIPEGDEIPIATACPNKLIVTQLNIVGSAVGNRREAIETLEMAGRGVVRTRFRTEKMENLGSVFEEMEKGKLMGRVVLDLQ